MSRWTKVALFLLLLTVFAIPFEYEYHKCFRHLAKAILPEHPILPKEFNKQIHFYRSDIAAIVLFLIALFRLRIPLRRLIFENKGQILWSLLFFSLLSILLSPLAHYPLPYTRLLQLTTALLLFSLCASSCFGPATSKWVLATLVLAGLLQTPLAIAQYFLQSPLGLALLGEPQCTVASFPLTSGRLWVFSDPSFPTNILRSTGTLFNPNPLGGFLAISLLASYSVIAEIKNLRAKRALILSLPLQFFALSLTFSRAAIFGWALGTFFWFALFFWQHRALPSRFFTATVVFSPLLSISLLWEQFFHRGGIISYNELARGSDAMRLAYQNNAFDLIWEKPLLGHGYEEYTFTSYAHGIDMGLPHNIYLILTVETGLLSLVAFLLFFALLFRAMLSSEKTPQILSLGAMLIALLFIGCCDAYPLRAQQGRLLFFISAGLLAAHCFQETRSHVPATS